MHPTAADQLKVNRTHNQTIGQDFRQNVAHLSYQQQPTSQKQLMHPTAADHLEVNRTAGQRPRTGIENHHPYNRVPVTGIENNYPYNRMPVTYQDTGMPAGHHTGIRQACTQNESPYFPPSTEQLHMTHNTSGEDSKRAELIRYGIPEADQEFYIIPYDQWYYWDMAPSGLPRGVNTILNT